MELSGDPAEVADRLGRIPGARVVLDPAEQAAVWAVRRAGIGSALRDGPAGPGDPRPLAIIEDPAVPPERLPELARGIRRILDREGLDAVWYGHASVGCLHIRPRMDLRAPGAVAALRRIAEETADLVCSLDGSLSGEHGDGRARSELLPRMYPPATIAAFVELKRLLDPDRILNPGVLTEPDRLDENLRLAASPPRRARSTAMSFATEGGLARAGEACNGNGACRAGAGAMCPSYQALGDERHSTRGRAAILRGALEGRLPAGLADDGLHEALELCLGCKACAEECPARVDMARLKVEALAHRHRARGVPWEARVVGRAHELLALGSRAPGLARLAAAVAGRIAGEPLPAPCTPLAARRPAVAGRRGPRPADGPDGRHVHPLPGARRGRGGGAGARGGRRARWRSSTPAAAGGRCCRRAWWAPRAAGPGGRSTGSRPTRWRGPRSSSSSRRAGRCSWTTSRAWCPHDPRAEWVAGAAVSFERAVRELGLPGLRPAGDEAVVHEHCHARALGGGLEGAAALLELAGPGARDSGAGCCGMAGSFGYRHPELSRRIAEDRLVPAARGADVAVAAGTSCRAQIRRVAGTRALHPAEYLAARLP